MPQSGSESSEGVRSYRCNGCMQQTLNRVYRRTDRQLRHSTERLLLNPHNSLAQGTSLTADPAGLDSIAVTGGRERA